MAVVWRILAWFGLLAAISLSAVPCSADQTDPRLDRLFVQLQEARTEQEITALMLQITGIWAQSGSDTIDLLFARAREAQDKGAPEVAYELMDKVVALAPRFAEGWMRRGVLNADNESVEEAISDLREALKLEPRHFGALDQMGRVMETMGDPQGASEAYERLLQIVPQAEGVRQRLNKLNAAPPNSESRKPI